MCFGRYQVFFFWGCKVGGFKGLAKAAGRGLGGVFLVSGRWILAGASSS